MAEQRRYSTTTAKVLAEAAVEREARKTRRALWFEEAIRAFWPSWTVVALFAGLVLLGVPAMFGPVVHIAILAVFAVAFLGLTARGIFTLHRPTRSEALARLDHGQRGRPAQTYADALAAGTGDKATEALWAAHQRSLAERAAALKAKAPDLRASRHDPFAFRHAGLLALAAGALAWFGADGLRIVDQLKPGAVAAAPAPSVTVEAWASPPTYTGVRAVYLSRIAPGDGLIALPVGSEISLRVFDAETPPTLTQSVAAGAPAFEDKGAGVHDVVFDLRAEGEVSIMAGEEALASWRFAAIPDAAPEIAFDGLPNGGERGSLTLPYVASDDYGVRVADARIELDRDAPPPVAGELRPSLYEPIELELPMPLTGDSREIRETLVEDLTEHPWAGLPVVITITARDAAEQAGSAEMRVPMPGRTFYHPVARALIEQRRALAFSPDAAPRVLDVLEAVMAYPEEIFDDNTGYLVSRMAVRRLGYALEDGRLEAETKSVIDLLWKAAIRLEDGDLASAAERLARAQERLKEAIENGASDEEIARLMEELREAMRDYLAQLAEEAQRDMAQGQQQRQQGQQGEQQQITQQQLEEMLNQLEEAIKNGQTELARQMLQALQQMMNNLQMAQPGQGQPGQGEQTMNQMGDMIGEQQGLADRTFDQMQRGQQGRQPGQQQGGGENFGQEGDPNGMQGGDRGDSSDQIARDQEQLRRLLDELRENLPGAAGEGTRRALEDAERAMGDAVDSLDRGDERQAVDDQVRALDELRDARRQMGRDLAEAQGQGEGETAARDGRGGESEREDPLGRPTANDGPMDGDSVRVPGAALGKRARELQDEIRRRAGERERPAEELDYLERLLDRF